MKIVEILRGLKGLDLLAPSVTLTLNGSSTVKTWLGFALTLLYVLIFSSSTYIISLSYLRKDQPTTSINEKINDQSINLYEENLFPVLFLLKDESLYLTPAEAVKFFSLEYKSTQIGALLNESGLAWLNLTENNMEVVPCSQLLSDPQELQPYSVFQDEPLFKKMALEYGFCIKGNKENSYVRETGEESNSKSTKLIVNPCKLTSGCEDVIEVERVSILLASTSSQINLFDYESPVTKKLRIRNRVYINHLFHQQLAFKITPKEIYDNNENFRSYINGASLKSSYFELEQNTAEASVRSRNASVVACPSGGNQTCEPYTSIVFTSSLKGIVYLRIYKSMAKTIGEIGGLNSAIFIAFLFITNIYSQYAQRRYLVNHIFQGFTEIKKKNHQKQIQAVSKTGKLSNRTDHPDRDQLHQNVQRIIDSDNKEPLDANSLLLSELSWKEKEELKTSAYNIVKKSTDLAEIAKEMMRIKVLSDLYLEEKHKEWAPYLVLTDFKSKDRQEKNQNKAKRNLSEHQETKKGTYLMPFYENGILSTTPASINQVERTYINSGEAQQHVNLANSGHLSRGGSGEGREDPELGFSKLDSENGLPNNSQSGNFHKILNNPGYIRRESVDSLQPLPRNVFYSSKKIEKNTDLNQSNSYKHISLNIRRKIMNTTEERGIPKSLQTKKNLRSSFFRYSLNKSSNNS